MSGSILTYTAAPGEVNHVTVSLSGSTYTVGDAGITITPGSGCSAVQPDRVTCSLGNATQLAIDVGDMSDTVTVSAPTPATITDGSGNDTITRGLGGAEEQPARRT